MLRGTLRHSIRHSVVHVSSRHAATTLPHIHKRIRVFVIGIVTLTFAAAIVGVTCASHCNFNTYEPPPPLSSGQYDNNQTHVLYLQDNICHAHVIYQNVRYNA